MVPARRACKMATTLICYVGQTGVARVQLLWTEAQGWVIQFQR